MDFHPSPDLFRIIGGILCFIAAVLLWSALATEDYVTNHFLLTIQFQSSQILADQYFTLGAYHLCSSISYYLSDIYIGGTSTHCPSIGEDCGIYLQLQDLAGNDLYPEPGLPLGIRRSCSTFLAGRAFLIISALGFTFVSLIMTALPCPPFQRLTARWGQAKVDRALVVEGVMSTVVALISILCQPDNASDAFEDGEFCAEVVKVSSKITNCQTPVSSWGSSFDMHAVAIVLAGLGVCFYIGGWRMGVKQDLQQPLVNNDRGEIGGLAGQIDSDGYGNVNHSYAVSNNTFD